MELETVLEDISRTKSITIWAGIARISATDTCLMSIVKVKMKVFKTRIQRMRLLHKELRKLILTIICLNQNGEDLI